MIDLNLQYFGGRGSGSGLGGMEDWLSKEGGNSKGTPHPIDTSKFDGWSLEQVEGRIRELKHEELFVLDENDNVTAAYKGNRHSVGFPSDLLNQEGITVTHNHPGGKDIENFGGTFSWADINNMLNSKWAEHRATASGQGEMNYIMRRTAKADSVGLRRQINKDFQRINKKWKKVYQDAYDAEIKKGTDRTQAKHIARQKGVGVLNRYYKDTFGKYGFEYITRKEDYRYGR